MQATIIVDVSAANESAAVEAWFGRWRGALSSVSDDLGCGCCVHIWDVDAPDAALAELPPATLAGTRESKGHGEAGGREREA